MSEPWSLPLPLALSLWVGVWLLVCLPRRRVPARSLALFRCLLPSWRFFDQVEPVPALLYRVAAPGEGWSGWRGGLVAPRRTLASLGLNAAGNLHLAQQSLIEHLVADLEDAAERGQPAEGLVSYRLVCALVEQRLSDAASTTPSPRAGASNAGASPLPVAARRYQFCLADAQRAAGAQPDADALFLSGVHGAA